MEDTKTCPCCGAEIKAVARKCRFCGQWLEEPTAFAMDDAGSGAVPPPPGAPRPAAAGNSKSKTVMWIALGLAVAAIIVALVFTLNSDGDNGPAVEDYSASPAVEAVEEVQSDYAGEFSEEAAAPSFNSEGQGGEYLGDDFPEELNTDIDAYGTALEWE